MYAIPNLPRHRILILFGSESLLYIALKGMADHMKAMKDDYTDMASSISKFYIKVVFRIDRIVQKFLYSCAHAKKFSEVRFNFLDSQFESLRDAIEGGGFTCNLPQRYLSKDGLDKVLYQEDLLGTSAKQKSNSSNKTQAKEVYIKKEKDEKKKGTDKSKCTENPNPNSAWQLPSDFNMGGLLRNPDKSNPVPKNKNNAFCMMYHLRGKCRNSSHCTFEHADPRSCGKEEEMNQFVKKILDKH